MRRRETPSSHMPGTVLPPTVPRGECDQVLIMPIALGSLSRAAPSSASETGIGTAVPTSAMRAMRAGWRAAHSRAVSEPML
jgi:hypothetical protein